MRISPRCCLALLLALLAGCGRAPAPPADAAGREPVRAFFEAILHQDWSQAYAVVHADSQARVPLEEFSRLAQEYRRNLGFEPGEVRIRSCSLQGTEGLAHIVWIGRKESRTLRYNDGIVLRQSDGNWRVVLGNNFGARSQ